MSEEEQIEQLKELFFRYEDFLDQKGFVNQFVPFDIAGTTLDPEFYDEGIKVTITIQTFDEVSLNEDLSELVADSIYDYLRENRDLEEEVRGLDIDPEWVNWWFVVKTELVE